MCSLQSFSERALIMSERERRSNSYWWALSASAAKIKERKGKLLLVFANFLVSSIIF